MDVTSLKEPVGFGVVLFLLLVLVWLLAMLRKALGRQLQAADHVEEALALTRQIVDLQLQTNALAERSLHNQDEMIRLLRQIAGERTPTEITTSSSR